jgi:hypothetical protein
MEVPSKLGIFKNSSFSVLASFRKDRTGATDVLLPRAQIGGDRKRVYLPAHLHMHISWVLL